MVYVYIFYSIAIVVFDNVRRKKEIFDRINLSQVNTYTIQTKITKKLAPFDILMY